MRERIDEFLNNETLILDIKSGLVLSVSVLLPMLYFLYSKNFNIGGLLNAAFGILSLFVILGNVMTFFEISDKAIRDEHDVNNELVEEEKKTIDKQRSLPKDIDPIITFNRMYNTREQQNANKILTDKIIAQLENKITTAKIRNKPYQKYMDRIELLKQNPMYDKSYKPVELKHIILTESKKDTQIKGRDAMHINPRMYGFRRFIIKQPLKSLSIGGSGMFILAVSDSFVTILSFYLIYIVSLALLCVFRYPAVRKILRTLYITTLGNKRDYITEFHDWNGKVRKEKATE